MLDFDRSDFPQSLSTILTNLSVSRRGVFIYLSKSHQNRLFDYNTNQGVWKWEALSFFIDTSLDIDRILSVRLNEKTKTVYSPQHCLLTVIVAFARALDIMHHIFVDKNAPSNW